MRLKSNWLKIFISPSPWIILNFLIIQLFKHTLFTSKLWLKIIDGWRGILWITSNISFRCRTFQSFLILHLLFFFTIFWRFSFFIFWWFYNMFILFVFNFFLNRNLLLRVVTLRKIKFIFVQNFCHIFIFNNLFFISKILLITELIYLWWLILFSWSC